MTGPRDDGLTEVFRASMPGQPEQACPAPETLWSAARGELSGPELEALASHLRTCAACGEALAVSAELAAEAEPRVVALPPRRIPRIAGAAAGITALAAGLLVFLVQRAPARPGSRTAEVEASRGEAAGRAAIRSLSTEEQPASGARLMWTPVERALRYRVQLSTADLHPVYDRTVEAPALTLPLALADLARQRAGGAVLLWQVEALLPDGQTVVSPTFRIRLVPPPDAPR
jgi:putative zinc finger protein